MSTFLTVLAVTPTALLGAAGMWGIVKYWHTPVVPGLRVPKKLEDMDNYVTLNDDTAGMV